MWLPFDFKEVDEADFISESSFWPSPAIPPLELPIAGSGSFPGVSLQLLGSSKTKSRYSPVGSLSKLRDRYSLPEWSLSLVVAWFLQQHQATITHSIIVLPAANAGYHRSFTLPLVSIQGRPPHLVSIPPHRSHGLKLPPRKKCLGCGAVGARGQPRHGNVRSRSARLRTY